MYEKERHMLFLQLCVEYCICVFVWFVSLSVDCCRCWGCTGPLGVSKECSFRLDPLFNTKTTPLIFTCVCVCVLKDKLRIYA